MSVSFVSAHSANAASVNITTPQSGDIILVFAYRNNNTTIPGEAAGYTTIDSAGPGGSANSYRLAYKVSDGTETNSGTWTNATNIVVQIFRGVNSLGTPSGSSGNSAILSYAGLTLDSSGNSWVAGFGGAKAATAGMNGSLTSLTNRTSQTTVNGLSSGPLSTFSTETLSVTGSGRWVTSTVELIPSAATVRTLEIDPISYETILREIAIGKAFVLGVTPAAEYTTTLSNVGLSANRRLRIEPPSSFSTALSSVDLTWLRIYRLQIEPTEFQTTLRDISIGKAIQFRDKVSVVKVQHGEQGPQGPQGPQGATGEQGPAGTNGLNFFLTNESHTVPSNADGSNPILTGAVGTMKVYSGATEVTSGITFSVANSSGCTGTIHASTGAYSISTMTADAAWIDFQAVYAGTTAVRRMSLAKSKQGTTGTDGSPGADAKIILLVSNRQIVAFDKSGNALADQDVVFDAQRVNTTVNPTWSMLRLDGTTVSSPVWGAPSNIQRTMTPAQFNTNRGSTEGVIVIATITDGVTISDRISVVKVQEGATGASAFTLSGYGTGSPKVYSPTSIGKEGGNGAWNAAVRSIESHSRGAFVSFRGVTGRHIMVGLNSDPLTSSSFTDIDFAWYLNANGGGMWVYENGVGVDLNPSAAQYTANTVFAITYDGQNVRYLRDGVVVRTVTRPSGAPLFLDSSFYHSDTVPQVLDLSFGPMGEAGANAFTLVPHGTGAVVFSPNSAGKRSGGDAWNGGVYSAEGFTRGCFVSCRPNYTFAAFMVGLNSDPTSDASYTSLDYAWQFTNTGQLWIFEQSGYQAQFGTYTAATRLAITYDGATVRYMKDGEVVRSVARAPGAPLHLDSSFFHEMSVPHVGDLAFGPMGEVGANAFTLVGRGSAIQILSSNSIKRGDTNPAWDGVGAYSRESYQRGCSLSFTPGAGGTTGDNTMVGLNTDPLANTSFTFLDFAWFCGSPNVPPEIYESGTYRGAFGPSTWNTNTVFSITYDGRTVRYYVDGVLYRSVPRALGAPLHFDSNLRTTASGASNISFTGSGEVGPGSDIEVPYGMAGVGGRLLIGARPNTKLAAGITSSQTTIITDHLVLQNGDRVVLQAVKGGNQQTEYMAITSAASGTGPYTYSVTRGLNGSSFAWSEGDTIVDLGVTGSHFIDQYTINGLKSASEAGPTIVGSVRNSATWNDWSPRWAIGNLNGLFGYIGNIFGFAAGNPSGPWIKVDPTNGVRIGHNATTKIQLDASGNASFTGSITASSGTIGGLAIGTDSLSIGAFLLQTFPGNTMKMAVGSPHAWNNSNTKFYVDAFGNFSLGTAITWDGTDLVIKAGQYTFDNTGLQSSLGGGGGIWFDTSNPSYAKTMIWRDTTELQVTPDSVFINKYLHVTNGIHVSSGGTANQVIGPRQAAVADATATVTSVQTQLNLLLSRLRTHGLIAS